MTNTIFSIRSTRSVERKKKSIWFYIKRDILLYLLLVPALIYFTIFRYGPMGGLVIAFKNYNMFEGIWGSEWVGLEVFKKIFQEDFFWLAVKNTVLLNLIVLAVKFPLSIFLSLLLNEVTSKTFKKTAQSILYLPYFVSWVTIAGIVTNLFSMNNGAVNNMIKGAGGEPIQFLLEHGWWITVYVFANTWKDVGWGTIIYMAALSGVDESLYEAAKIDGAGRIKCIWYIALPSIKSTMVVMFILSISQMMHIGLDAPLLLQNSKVIEVGEVLSTYVYKMGLQRVQYSFATAVGLFQSVINITLLLMANAFAKLLGEDGVI
ncbi:ABC transporter permease [Cellulosilyticum sp. I15G10I2]|uniref:ABC transporter permease n=1 Tax=Cellulosilyticum sp. I15G10I2 TaxID=1892843 RepID=UPI00085CB8D0|nr:ABC transporter permease subunit [Cellulosilyticum sp. I15G10I2]